MSISDSEQNRHAVFRRDIEFEQLKKERDELLTRERTARAEAETAQRRLSELASMSKTFASSMRGVTVERRRSRRHLAVQYTVGRLLAESDGLEDAAPGVLETMGKGLGWDLGVLWTVDEDAGVLRCDEVWRTPENGRSSVAAGQHGFESASRRKSLPSGSDLPGRVWARGEALWIEDVLEDEGFLRKEAAVGEGLRKAFAFPIRDGSRPLGVVEFFGREAAPPDEDLLRVATLIGIQIGQFLERRRAEEERERLFARERVARAEADAARREVADILESRNDAFFNIDGERRFTYINRAAEEFWNRSREELLGRNIWEEFPQAVGSEPYEEIERAAREGTTTEFEAISPMSHSWISGRVYTSLGRVSVFFQDITERKRAEEALRRSEERYRTLFESIDEGFCIIEMMFDQNGEPVDYRFLETNPAFEKHTGLHEATGKRMRELAPDHDAHWFEIYGKVALTGEPVRFVNEAKALDDRWFDVYAFRLGGRKSRKVAVIFNNITERRRTEEALRKSEERYKSLYEDNPFMYFTVDKRGTVLSVNRSGAEQLGYTVEELVGCSVLDIFHEEDKEGVSRYLSMCLQNLERPSSWEARKVRKDGSTLWAKENLRIVEGPDGDTIGLLLCEDITERKQAEEQILLQTQLLEQVQAAVISTDLQGTVTYWNEHAEKLYGWPREEALGCKIVELIVRAEEAEVTQEIMERHRAGETWEGELVVRRKDGSTFPAHVTDSLIYDAQGHAVGVVGVSTDITERKKAEEERGRLLAHEWRAHAETEERKRISRELHDRVAHSMAVVHQSLELYGALKERDPDEAVRKLELARETTKTALHSTRDLSMTLRNEAKDGLAPALSHLLSTAVPPDMQTEVSVKGDSSLVPQEVRDQLFLTLREGVRNAVSHSGAGRITVAVEITPEKISGSVEDDGRGFDPRGAASHTSGGLKSMKERMTLIGGSLRLDSTPGGTRIEVDVPLSQRG